MKNVSEKELVNLLESRRVSLESELKRTEEALIALTGDYSGLSSVKSNKLNASPKKKDTAALSIPTIPSEYDVNHKWDLKILFALSKIGPADKYEVAEEIANLEPALIKEDLLNIVGVKLSYLLKNKAINAERNGRKFKYLLQA